MGEFFWARVNSPSAQNNVINLINGEPAIEIEFLNQTIAGAPGDYQLELPADGNGNTFAEVDPDTVIVVNGVTYQFSVEASGPTPIDGKVPTTLQEQQTVVLRLYDSSGNMVQRLVIVLESSDGDRPTEAEMNAIANGNISLTFDPGGTNTPVCFLRGTLIATPSGQVPVEELKAGDQVLTASGTVATIRFVASRPLSENELTFRPEMRPVRIPQGAMGSGLPSADLWVSPQHRVLVRGWEAEMLFGEPEVLLAAKHLKIAAPRPAMPETVEYFHLMLDQHDIVLSNGIETESLFPGDTAIASLTEEARAGMERAFPEFAGDWAFYGPTARRTLTAKEAEALWAKMAPLGAEAVRDVA